MKIFLLYFFLSYTLLFSPLFGQLVLKDGGVVKLNGGTSGSPIYFVLNAPPATPIATIVTAGNPANGIVMEAEYNILQYNLSTATTPITVPYLSNSLESIPLTLTPTSAGVGAGNIKFSSKVAPGRATGWDNTLYMPSDVTNMGSIGIANNSSKTIDRFWIIDANGYSTKPAVTLNFSYIDAEWAANSATGSNSINEANLLAQRFNSSPSINDWEGYLGFLPAGTINTTNNTVTGVNVSAANFFRSWTLNDKTSPLPIELINFEANCISNKTVFEWCTATETNNDYFTITQSTDGVNFTTLIQVDGNGTTGQKHCYTFTTDNKTDAIVYYQLWQTDFDKTTKKLKLVSVEACNGKIDNSIITNTGTKNVNVIINSLVESNDEVIIHNTLGQIIMHQSVATQQGKNQYSFNLSSFCNGVYYVSIIRNNQTLNSKKIIITDN